MISIVRSPVTLSILIAVGLGLLPDRLTESHTQRFDEKKESFSAALASIASPGGDRGRFGMWASTIDQIADYPIIGVGLGNWEYIYPLYDGGAQIRATSSAHRPHNDLLWIWSETGSVGLLIYLGLLLLIFQVCLRTMVTGTQDDRSTVLASMVAMVAFIGVGMFSFPFERVPPEFHFWLSASFVFICSPRPATRPTIHARTLTYILLPLVLLGALLITVRHIQFDRHYINAHIAYLKRDFEECARSAELALQHGSFEHQAYMMVGEGGYHRGDWEAAETGYRNTLRYHPHFANAHNGLGLVDIARGDHPAALEHFNKATDIIAGHHVAIFNKGICFESLGQTDSAIAQYRKAYQSYYTTPYVNLGAIYRKQNKVDSAIAVYTTAAHGTVPAPEAWFNLGNIYSEKKEFASSGHAYVEFLKLWAKEDSVWAAARKGLSQSYSGYGVQLEQRGEVDSARAAYERSLDIDPNEPVNWFNLGNILRAKSQFDEAAGAYEKAIALDPQHLDSHNNLGMTYRDLGDDNEAIEIYRKAKAFAPNNAILNFNLGQALLVVGNSAEANEQLETFRKNWEGDTSLVHYHLGNAYYQSGLLQKADTEYSAFLLKWRGDEGIRASVEGFLKSIRSSGAQ
jgi:tetratricopeptide (TPR) repeat protein